MKLPCPHCNCHETEPMPSAFIAALARLPRQKASHPFDVIHDLLGVGPESHQRRCQPERIFLHKVAPPQRIPYVPIMGCWYLAALAVTLIPSGGGTLACYVIFVLGGVNLHQAYMFNRNEWPHLFEKWERSHICHDCGKIFVSEES
ncbi:MAG TPA: hypothetical protein VJ550_08150 [Geomonas sp.]|nr:hypothetical protein [Geomonas sp.]